LNTFIYEEISSQIRTNFIAEASFIPE